MPKRPNTPYKTKTQRVGWTRVLSPSSGGHSKMSPTSTLRGLGLGETPLRRWEAVTEMGRSQALIRTIVTPSQRQRPNSIDIAVQRLVLHRSVTPSGVAKFPTPETQGEPLNRATKPFSPCWARMDGH